MNFTHLNHEQFNTLTANAVVIKTRREKPVLLQTPDNTMIKIIPHRGGWSSSRLWPYAKRFLSNSLKLPPRGIQVPRVKGLYRVQSERCDIVTYQKIPGMSVREHWQQGNTVPLQQTPQFIAELHQRGIFFRDLHLANLLVTDQGFALIDLASVQCHRRALSEPQRQRNLLHLLDDNDDGPIVRAFGLSEFLSEYQQRANIDAAFIRRTLDQVRSFY